MFIGAAVTISLLIIGLCITAFKDFITQNRELILNRQRQQNEQIPVQPVVDGEEEEDEVEEIENDDTSTDDELVLQHIMNHPPIRVAAPAAADQDANQNNQNNNAAANDIANNLVNNLDNEEVDLEEVIGLNGRFSALVESFVFVMASNFIYLLLIAFFPFNIGLYFAKVVDYTHDSIFSYVSVYSTTLTYLLFGYLVLILTFFTLVLGICVLYNFLPVLQRSPFVTFIYQIIMYGYTFVKLITTTTINFVVMPIYCGTVINLSTADFFGVTVQERITSIKAEPVSSIVIHFFMGIFYLFQVSFFVRTMREFFRPGVLWFLSNPEDPNYSYIKELIKTPLITQIRRHVMTELMFAVVITSLLRGPLKLLKELIPSLFPLHATLSTPLLQAATDVFLFMFLLIVAVENIQLKPFVKPFLQRWFTAVGNLLNLNGYLFGIPIVLEGEEQDPDIPPHLQVYKAPYFPIRIAMLIIFG